MKQVLKTNVSSIDELGIRKITVQQWLWLYASQTNISSHMLTPFRGLLWCDAIMHFCSSQPHPICRVMIVLFVSDCKE